MKGGEFGTCQGLGFRVQGPGLTTTGPTKGIQTTIKMQIESYRSPNSDRATMKIATTETTTTATKTTSNHDHHDHNDRDDHYADH